MTDKLYDGLNGSGYYHDAWRLVLATHEESKKMGEGRLTNRFAGTLVAMDPHVRPSSDNPSKVSLAEVREAAAFMDRLDGDYDELQPAGNRLVATDFDEFALTKARDLWVLGPRMGMPYFTSHELQMHPELFVPGMTHYVGGVWNRGRVTTFSGVEGDYDVATAVQYDAWVTAQARIAVMPVFDRSTNPSGFIGGDDARDPMFR